MAAIREDDGFGRHYAIRINVANGKPERPDGNKFYIYENGVQEPYAGFELQFAKFANGGGRNTEITSKFKEFCIGIGKVDMSEYNYGEKTLLIINFVDSGMLYDITMNYDAGKCIPILNQLAYIAKNNIDIQKTIFRLVPKGDKDAKYNTFQIYDKDTQKRIPPLLSPEEITTRGYYKNPDKTQKLIAFLKLRDELFEIVESYFNKNAINLDKQYETPPEIERLQNEVVDADEESLF